MSADVAAVIAADKAACVAERRGIALDRLPVYIAAIEAVTALIERAEKDVTVDRPIQYVWSKDLRRALAVLAPSTEETK